MGLIYGEILDDRWKGVPLGTAPFALRTIGSLGWRIGTADLPMPLLVARKRAIEHNIEAMQRYCSERGVELAPHGKTTMCPQLFKQQLAAGAWAITVATVQQLAVCRRYGVKRVIFANQLVGAANARYVAEELARDPQFKLFSFVDSPESVRSVADAARAAALTRPFDVILEVGYTGGRTGVRSGAIAGEVAAAIAAQQGAVRLCGVGGFEGLLVNDPASRLKARTFLEYMAHVTDILIEKNYLPEQFIITAGGSSAFDLVADVFGSRWPARARVVLRSGCYVAHDHGLYRMTAPADLCFQPALELWSCVQSRPEPALAYLAFGRRDASFDAGMPVPLYSLDASGKKSSAASYTIESLNDQHARLRLPSESALQIGDIVVCGISHPCTSFDKWRLIMVVDDDDVVVDGLLTYF